MPFHTVFPSQPNIFGNPCDDYLTAAKSKHHGVHTVREEQTVDI